jgi:hypothetical protein
LHKRNTSTQFHLVKFWCNYTKFTPQLHHRRGCTFDEITPPMVLAFERQRNCWCNFAKTAPPRVGVNMV